MSSMRKVAISCDHGGVSLKAEIKEQFSDIDWIDLGTDGTQSVNYPDYGYAMAEALKDGKADTGIIICGSGIGISIAANRHAHVRAALCVDTTMARLARQHNDANVLALGARTTGAIVALDCVETFLKTQFEGGRHALRVEKLNIGA